MPGSFFDTNVLLYVAAADTSKADRAQELLRDGGLVSVQVLNEMANVLRRKMRLTWAENAPVPRDHPRSGLCPAPYRRNP